MSFWNIVENVLIGPLKLVFEVIFQLANRFIGHPGLSIVVLSLVMNILVLPLYKRADAMQEESRDIEMKLKKGVDHIKKSFTGDERMMILQTYYRQNNYKPTDALNGSVSLLLEIPFFMAAYQFLSNLGVMDGVSLGPIADLSKPDGLLVIGSLAINVLPVLMTLVNVISSAIYLKGFPLKTKIQLYGMALFFLVFLYESPACLVFYWTLNNVFSLVKTIFYKLKNPGKVLRFMASVVGFAGIVCAVLLSAKYTRRKIFLVVVGIALQFPLVLMFLKNRLPAPREKKVLTPNKTIFLLGSVFLTVLVGVLIPSTFIAASPQEFIDFSYFHNPLWYVVSCACLAAGTFLVWMRVFYWLASPKGKVIFDHLIWVLCGLMLINYMFFGTGLGVISSSLQYENGMRFSAGEQLLNLLVLAAAGAGLYLIAHKWNKAISLVLLTAVITVGGMAAVNLVTIKTEVDKVAVQQGTQEQPMASFELSTTGKNVVVIMLDRALGLQVPYIFNEKPELQEQFEGFTYYSNTVSFGNSTNFAAPALFGGYEYTPVEMNRRSDTTLAEKHNEALKLMPFLFAESGYDVTVCDPVYAGYQWLPDLTIFNEYDNIDAYITRGRYNASEQKQIVIENNYRNFFCLSILKTLPLVVQPTIYDDGIYNHAVTVDGSYAEQTRLNMSKAVGINQNFINAYNVLLNLTEMTVITDETKNTYMSMVNEATHDPNMMQMPDYTLSVNVDNSAYDAAHADRFTVDGRVMKVENVSQMIHYHSNMASFIQLANWFDFMRENGVWDNTRIILVSDHGRYLKQFDELILGDGTLEELDAQAYCPLLMVKDFNSREFTVDTGFMTNADVPTIAFADLIEDPINPFTGNQINSNEKFAHGQYIITSKEWNINTNNGNTFLPSGWVVVEDDIWSRNNWTVIEGDRVLDEHKLPE